MTAADEQPCLRRTESWFSPHPSRSSGLALAAATEHAMVLLKLITKLSATDPDVRTPCT